MKRFSYSTLIIVLTVVTIYVMSTMKAEVSKPVIMINDDKVQDDGKPEGTGYIFDDFDKGINLPVESPVEDEAKKGAAVDQPLKTAGYDFTRFMDLQREMREPPPPFVDFKIPENLYKNTADNEQKRMTEEEADREFNERKSRVTLQDRLYLLSLAKDLNLKEMDIIRRAMTEGVTYEEERRIWGILRTRLSDHKYFRLIEIVDKYEE